MRCSRQVLASTCWQSLFGEVGRLRVGVHPTSRVNLAQAPKRAVPILMLLFARLSATGLSFPGSRRLHHDRSKQ